MTHSTTYATCPKLLLYHFPLLARCWDQNSLLRGGERAHGNEQSGPAKPLKAGARQSCRGGQMVVSQGAAWEGERRTRCHAPWPRARARLGPGCCAPPCVSTVTPQRNPAGAGVSAPDEETRAQRGQVTSPGPTAGRRALRDPHPRAGSRLWCRRAVRKGCDSPYREAEAVGLRSAR